MYYQYLEANKSLIQEFKIKNGESLIDKKIYINQNYKNKITTKSDLIYIYNYLIHQETLKPKTKEFITALDIPNKIQSYPKGFD